MSFRHGLDYVVQSMILNKSLLQFHCGRRFFILTIRLSFNLKVGSTELLRVSKTIVCLSVQSLVVLLAMKIWCEQGFQTTALIDPLEEKAKKKLTTALITKEK